MCRCRKSQLNEQSVVIDVSKFKAVNNRDKTFTRGRWNGGIPRLSESVDRARFVASQATKISSALEAERRQSAVERRACTNLGSDPPHQIGALPSKAAPAQCFNGRFMPPELD